MQIFRKVLQIMQNNNVTHYFTLRCDGFLTLGHDKKRDRIQPVSFLAMMMNYLLRILNSTRLFCARPSSVSFGATGFCIPYPLYSRRVASTPLLMR